MTIHNSLKTYLWDIGETLKQTHPQGKLAHKSVLLMGKSEAMHPVIFFRLGFSFTSIQDLQDSR